jgi:hypothetical protein
MYFAGESQAVKRRLKVARFLVPVLCLLVGGLFWMTNDWPPAAAAWLVAVIFAIWSPTMIRWQHKRHFRNHIREKCQGMLNTEAVLRLEADGLRSQAESSDGIIKFTGIESLAEIEALYLIKLKQGLTILVPKATIEGALNDFMFALAEQCALPIEDRTHQRWAEPITK